MYDVTSFGQRGNKEGDFSGPCYLYIDKDHFVYVSEDWNHQIQCLLLTNCILSRKMYRLIN